MTKEELVLECKELNINLTDEMLFSLDKYCKLLTEWNKKFNLTTIIEEEDIYLKHFYDSICLVRAVDLNNQKLCDFGTGAGFPGIVLKIIFKSLDVVLVESNSKKAVFLNEVIKKLKLKKIEVINKRAEEYSKNKREFFDIVTCRAVSHLRVISELAVPMLKINGLFLPLKGEMNEELKESEVIIKKLNSKIENLIIYELPVNLAKRSIVVIRKTGKTEILYPREYNKIIKSS